MIAADGACLWQMHDRNRTRLIGAAKWAKRKWASLIFVSEQAILHERSDYRCSERAGNTAQWRGVQALSTPRSSNLSC